MVKNGFVPKYIERLPEVNELKRHTSLTQDDWFSEHYTESFISQSLFLIRLLP